MYPEAIDHVNDMPFAFPVGKTALKVRLRTKKGVVRSCRVLYSDRYVPVGKENVLTLTKTASDRLFDYYEGVISAPTKRVRYVFALEGADGNSVWYGENGAAENREQAGMFQYAYIREEDIFHIPEWVYEGGAVYQIFPERFCNGDVNNDPPHVREWTKDAKPASDSFYGGDLKGVMEKLPYLHDLGVRLLYLTPIFQSPSNHKYDAEDYFLIDPHFGDLSTVKALVEKAHRLGIRVMLDAVFNHCGDRFFAFQDVLKRGENSPYKDWFYIESFPVVQEPKPNYETFANHIASMPKLRTSHPEVKAYLLEVARYWVEEVGIDGWRLDVANEVDHAFWRDFRKTVKRANPDALIIGEIMHEASAWLRGDQFDGVMNYVFREAMVDFFAKQSIGVRTFMGRLVKSRMAYPDQANAAQFNLIDSHDTERFLTLCRENGWGWGEERAPLERMKLAVCFQLMYDGLPMIYYGDEIGMEGRNDPDCRRPMLWNENDQNRALRSFYQRLLQLRNGLPALQRGEFCPWMEDEARNVLGFVRRLDDQVVGVLLNNSNTEQRIETAFPQNKDGEKWINLWTGERLASGRSLVVTLPPYGFFILKNGCGQDSDH